MLDSTFHMTQKLKKYFETTFLHVKLKILTLEI